MGALSICGLGQTGAERCVPNQDCEDRHGGVRASVMKLMRPKCLGRRKKKKKITRSHQVQESNQHQVWTLEDLILASPGLNNGCTSNNGGEINEVKQISRRIYPSSVEDVEEDLISSNSRGRLCVERESKAGEWDGGDGVVVENGKEKKRVRFTMPALGDIIVFDSALEE